MKFLPVAKVVAGIYKGIEKYLCFSDFCGIITVQPNTNTRYAFCERRLIGKREILPKKLLRCPRNRKNVFAVFHCQKSGKEGGRYAMNIRIYRNIRTL